jgi:flagellar basal body-associated protein FliL
MLGSLLVGLLSLAGLGALIYLEPPNSNRIALGLVLVVLAVMGITAPVWRQAMKKATPKSSDREVTLVGLRLGLWSGIFLASIAMLKLVNFLDRVLVLAILALLIMIEMFLQQNAAKKRAARRSKR